MKEKSLIIPKTEHLWATEPEQGEIREKACAYQRLRQ